MQLTSVFVLVATLVASANALATPVHGVRMQRHSSLAKARAPAPEPAISSPYVSKRGLKKRCKPRTNTSSLLLPTSVGVGNVASAPVTSSVEASSAAPSSTPEPSPQPTPSPEPSPSPSSTKKVSSTKKSSTSQAAPTSSAAPAPEPTTEAPAPAPTTSSKASSSKKPTTTSQAPAATSAASSSSDSSLGQYAGTHSGQGTWYNTGLTACGVTNNDGQFIAAVSHLLFDTFPGYSGGNPNNNPICGRKAQVTYQGQTITVTITDRCEACALFDLDFTPTAFQSLASLGAGRIDGVSWHFV